ncbi:Rv1733c family protein [Nocardia blacklockiae]|uniref:Rv1733c family protein n=1 Tax=Nocardia blacklockiae TaxID=480036 RepID=UPI001892DD2A|nr:hypothetical protein [Nocardia blacklockiae]MBF6174749.1 hypothetical protein [Nocardia blacklockiae]
MARETSKVLRAWRLAPWARNPMLRPVDRLEGWIRLLAIVVVLLAVPASVPVGLAGYRAAVVRIEADNAAKAVVPAVISDDPVRVPATSRVNMDRMQARVRWSDGGRAGEATVDVAGTARRGDRIELWVGADGRPTTDPVPIDAAVGQGIGIGLLALSGVAAACGVSVWITAWVLNRRRSAAWEHEWREVSPAVGQ